MVLAMMRGHWSAQILRSYLQAGEEQDDAGAGDGAEGLVAVGEVGGNDFGCAGRGMGGAADDAEGLILGGEERGEVIGDDAACAEDGDHEVDSVTPHRRMGVGQRDGMAMR